MQHHSSLNQLIIQINGSKDDTLFVLIFVKNSATTVFDAKKYAKNAQFMTFANLGQKCVNGLKWDQTNEKHLFFTLYCLNQHLFTYSILNQKELQSKCVNFHSKCLNLYRQCMKLRRKCVKLRKYIKGWLAIAKLKPLSLSISLF